MFKKLLAVLVLSAVMVASASASTYGIIGGMVVSGNAIGVPVVIQFDGRELFLSEADCEAALQKILRATVTRANSNAQGVFNATEVWGGVNTTIKTNAATCIKTTQF